MYCPECGMLNEEGRRYCIQCGTRLDILTSTPPAPIEHSVEAPVSDESDSSKAESVSDNPYEGLSDEDYDILDEDDETYEGDVTSEERLDEQEVDEDEPEDMNEPNEAAGLEETDEVESYDERDESEGEENPEESDEGESDRGTDEADSDDEGSEGEDAPEEDVQSEESVDEVSAGKIEDEKKDRSSIDEDAKAETEEKENPAKQLAGKLASKIAEKKADFEQKRQEKLEQQQESDSSVPRNVYEEEPLDKKTLAIACVIALVVVLGITLVFFRVNDGAGSGGVVVSEDAPVVYFESGGADGGAMTPLRVEADRQVTVPKCGYIYTGHTFLGWRDPDAHLIVPGSVIRVTNDMTLTAVWDTDQRAISFNAAGGDGTMESVHVPRGISFTVPKCAFTWDGHFFSYWITNSGVTYLPGDVLIVDGDLELTAVWDAVGYKSEMAAKAEEAPEVGVLSADTLPNMWSGSFEVHSDAVEGGTFWRSVVLEFSEHNADGLVAGAATVGVLDDVPGAASGSYFFEGIIDWQTGHIEIVGTGWADQGTLTDMGGFRGTVDPNTNTMSGEWFDPNNIVLPGLWQVAAM